MAEQKFFTVKVIGRECLTYFYSRTFLLKISLKPMLIS